MDPGAGAQSPGVLITMGQVYSEVTGMRQEVRDLATTMKTAIAQIGDHESRLRTVEHDYVTAAELEKLAGRVSSLERFKWTVTPLAMALSGGIGAAVTKAMSGH